MPALSSHQQKFFGMVRAVQKGELSPRKVSKHVRDTAKKMDPESVKHYAQTKHKGLPERVEKKASDIDALLAPVDLSPRSESNNQRQIFSGIPRTDRAKTWDFALTEGGDGGRVLSFLVDNRTINFQLDPPGEGNESILANRLADSEVDDFAVGGASHKGRAQIHRSGPSNIYGTFQTGKNNVTFSLENDGDDKKWRVVPKKGPMPNVKSFVDAIVNKRAEFTVPHMDTLTAPITAPYGTALPLSALIGAGLMGTKNLATKAVDKVTGNEEERPSLAKDVITGAGVGAGATAIIKALGERPIEQKVASGDTLSLITLQSILGADPTLNPADRRILLDQANRAMRATPGSQTSISQLKTTGLGMLAGYAAAKLMGFGGLGQLASVAIGGGIGSSFASKSGPMWHSKGYTTY